MRKPNIRLWTRRLTLTAREAPAEMLLALYFFAIYSLNREHVLNDPTDYLLLMPIFFALSLLTNRWCRSPRSRIAYRLSPLAAVPFLWADVGGWVHSVAYPVTLIVSALTVFAGGWQRDNARFVERVLRYLSDAIASGLIALAAFLASCAIFFSIVYIFNILDDCSRGFTEYAAMASLLVVWPVLFLILDRDSERDQGNVFASGPFLDVLSNYILTPALLIYTAILYLYFAKIAIVPELLRGHIRFQGLLHLRRVSLRRQRTGKPAAGGAAHTIAHHTDVTVPGDPVSILIFLSHKASIRNGPGFYHDSAAPFFRSSISFRRSWPQEASISPPRLRRTVAVRP